MANVTLTALDISPNDCPLAAPLNVKLEFTTDQKIAGAVWEVSYMVDITAKRHVVKVGATDPVDYEAGPCSMTFSAPGIELQDVKPRWLNNAGLVLLILKDGAGAEVIQVSAVTQVMKEGDVLTRRVISPLE